MITAAGLLRRPSPPHQVRPPVFSQPQRPVPRQRHLVAAQRPGVALVRTHPRRDRTGLGRQEVVHFDLKPLLRVAHAMPDVTRVARGQVHDVGVADEGVAVVQGALRSGTRTSAEQWHATGTRGCQGTSYPPAVVDVNVCDVEQRP